MWHTLCCEPSHLSPYPSSDSHTSSAYMRAWKFIPNVVEWNQWVFAVVVCTRFNKHLHMLLLYCLPPLHNALPLQFREMPLESMHYNLYECSTFQFHTHSALWKLSKSHQSFIVESSLCGAQNHKRFIGVTFVKIEVWNFGSEIRNATLIPMMDNGRDPMSGATMHPCIWTPWPKPSRYTWHDCNNNLATSACSSWRVLQP